MATKSMAYDHPAYLVPYTFSGLTAAGANGVSTKFAAFTAMKLKQTVLSQVILTTAAGSQPYLYTKSGTTTSTSTLTVLTSAGTTPSVTDISDVTLAQGDQFWFTHGTDATTAVACAVEAVLIPGADVSV